MILSTLLHYLVFAATCTAAPHVSARNTAALQSHQSGGDEYIVILSKTSTAPRDVHAAEVLSKLDLSPGHPDVRLMFDNSAFHGFAASMQDHCLGLLANMSDVERVEKSVKVTSRRVLPRGSARPRELSRIDAFLRDTISHTTDTLLKQRDTSSHRTDTLLKQRDTSSHRTDTTWGLQRISSSSSVAGDADDLSYTYTTDTDLPGAGIDIYVVDSGINVQHEIFNGRVSMGFSFEADAADHDGHGTHVAGTAAGDIFGVASAARIVGVKVLGDDGSGSTADTISGMDYVISEHDRRKAAGQATGFVGSIMSMSWGLSSTSDAVSSAIAAASAAGIHISLAAGNSGDDACKYSPSSSGGASSPAIVTVGSVDIANAISSFSNTGSCVDLYAPGEQVLSSWIGGPVTVNFLSGTSMACPHVSGVMAYLMAQDPSLAADPTAMKQKLLSTALKGAISTDPNALLLNNGIVDGSSSKTKREVEWTSPGSEGQTGRQLNTILFERRHLQAHTSGHLRGFQLADTSEESRLRL